MFTVGGVLFNGAHRLHPNQEAPLSAEAADRILLNVLKRIKEDAMIRPEIVQMQPPFSTVIINDRAFRRLQNGELVEIDRAVHSEELTNRGTTPAGLGSSDPSQMRAGGSQISSSSSPKSQSAPP